jgi:DNA-binding NtrC family response regulator
LLQLRNVCVSVCRVQASALLFPTSGDCNAAWSGYGSGMALTSSLRLRPGRVLVVDDEPRLAQSIARVLAKLHRVDVETSARAALARLLEGGATYDVILSDVNMPEMGGPDLYVEVQRCLPDVARRFVFMTGDPGDPPTRAFLDRVENVWMEKPLDIDSLHALIERRIRELAPGPRASSAGDL